jgi:hypothetical protein
MAKRQLKLPRKVAGIKISKRMRKSANRITRHFETPLGRELIAGALVAAAGALVGSRYVRETAAEVGQQVRTRTQNLVDSSGAVSSGAAELKSNMESLVEKKKKKDRNKKDRKQGIQGSPSTH